MMRNFAKVISRRKYNVEFLTIRNSANCRLRQWSTNEMESKETCSTIKKPLVDERTLLAITAITERYNASRYSTRDKFYRVMDKEVAKHFAKLIMSHPAKNPSYVAEISPAFGLLTRALLDAGVPKINVFESMEYFCADLTHLQEEYLGRVNVKKMAFDKIRHLGYWDLMHGTKNFSELMNGVEKRSWDDEPTVHIIGAVPNNQFISIITSMVMNRYILAKYGRLVLHLAMAERDWIILSAGNSNYRYYKSMSILFQILFNYQLLGTLPRKAFCPQPTRRLKRRIQHSVLPKYDVNTMCVVRIEAKCDLHKYGLPQQNLLPFCQFVKYHYKKRSNRIIPEMERWVPGCGRALIAAGYDINTQFGELLPAEIIKLFLQFKSWPGYKKSPFMSMFDIFPKKMDEESVLGTTTDNIDEMFKVSREAFRARDLETSQSQDKSTDKLK